ncbi:hypothetical protein SDC9_66809 [bioreactor metagenome]|uniref:Uncharacterized protein n=1 Tax=bioreactor metagenome TaxID=1076179 RepID=A0A644XVY8_9ZZZZ
MRRGAVGNDFTLHDLLSGCHNGFLVNTGALVGAQELDELIFVDIAAAGVNHDMPGIDRFNGAGPFCQNADA